MSTKSEKLEVIIDNEMVHYRHLSFHKPKIWTLENLQAHLQAAVDLEFWTIPFYMSAMYSIKDPASIAYQLILSVVNQEMLHVQLASNIANSFGLSPVFKAGPYEGQKIPHLDFNLDKPNPTETFSPYSAEIGPFDISRLNSMCLIEYPQWKTGHTPDFKQTVTEYGSIGEFYQAVEFGAIAHVQNIKGSVNQIDHFSNFYKNMKFLTVTDDFEKGLEQAVYLVTGITDQGEGQRKGKTSIPPDYQNTADDIEPSWTHYKKFIHLRDMVMQNNGTFPETYTGVANPAPGSAGEKAQNELVENFSTLLKTFDAMFSGKPTPDFTKQMIIIGSNILTCWQNGAIPKFYK